MRYVPKLERSRGCGTRIVHSAAAFDITGRKTSATLSDIFRFTHKTARQESSKFYSDLRNETYQVLLYQLLL